MKGLELSEKFYTEYGATILEKAFPDLVGIVAVGLCGSGSECFGYDDEISRDHDFEPGFCIFIPDESIIDEKMAFRLEKAYSTLPKSFMGYERSTVSAVGGNRHGVIRLKSFLIEKTGTTDGILQLKDWFYIPEQALAEVTNGKIFRDDSRYFTEIRERLSYFPEDVRLKKLAGNLLLMGQSGQYNYSRSVKRGETAAAQLAIGEFVKSAMNVVFLLNKKYVPYYKWSFKALKELSMLSDLYSDFEYLISSPNTEAEAELKKQLVEKICDAVFCELKEQSLTRFSGTQAEGHAYSVNNEIKNNDLRNCHILYGV